LTVERAEKIDATTKKELDGNEKETIVQFIEAVALTRRPGERHLSLDP